MVEAHPEQSPTLLKYISSEFEAEEEEEKKEIVVATQAKRATNEQGFFMKRSKMPSILCFSLVLLFYGGKFEMRRLLTCLSKGGAIFFAEKVKNGHFFKQQVCDANMLHLNLSITERFEQARQLCKNPPTEDQK